MSLHQLIDSLKGISGTGNVLSGIVKLREEFGKLVMEPGDFARSDHPLASSAPIGYDLWYLWAHDNFLAHYFTGIDGDHYDYSGYVGSNLKFINDSLPGLKPMKVLRTIAQLAGQEVKDESARWTTYKTEWANNGVYWVNTMAFEVWARDKGFQFPSDGPRGFSPNDYAGYISFPIGQLGVMEVISLIQETLLSGYQFSSTNTVALQAKGAIVPDDDEKPYAKPPEMFPAIKDDSGNALAGTNKCYGTHLMESAYLTPEASKRDVELLSKKLERYAEAVEPKMWMRYWIHKESTLPIPGEFIGIICKPALPPHVWWFQESSPFLYAGNWMETGNLTSGVITEVILEENRTDGLEGNRYKAKIHGCEVVVEASDYFLYAVGDRVAIMKIDSTVSKRAASFTWNDQVALKSENEGVAKANYVIIPATYYKI